MKDLIYASAAALAKAIKSGEVSSEEVVTAHLARIEEVNPRLNAVVQLTAESALKQAKAADAELAKGRVVRPAARCPGHDQGQHRNRRGGFHQRHKRAGPVCAGRGCHGGHGG